MSTAQSAPKFSPEQLDAIQARGENLLVSAAAGSGKTAVLVERIVTLLQEGESIANMLIVTFTRAAAAQMRERITKALEKGEQTPRLRREQALVSRAQIKTIHTFCAWLLRENFIKADLPPSFRVDGGTMLLPIRQRCLEDALDDALLRDFASLSRLCTVDQLGDLVLRVCSFLENQVDPMGYAKALPQNYERMWQDFENSPQGKILVAERERLISQGEAMIRQGIEICNMPGGPDHYIETLAEDLQVVSQWRKGIMGEFSRLPSKRSDCDEDLKGMVQAIRKAVKDLPVHPSLTCAEEIDVERMASMQPCVQALMDLCMDFLGRYDQAKMETGLLDYSDLEHRTLLALSDEGVQEGIRNQFAHVFVDEYQDVNAVQEAILTALARENNRFMVGDVKQSIYRFRLADPGIFLAASDRFGKGEGGRRIDLNRNYRSNVRVLDGVNYVFSHLLTGAESEVLYDDAAALRPGRQDEPGAPVEVLLLDQPDEGDAPSPDEEVVSAVRKEANAIALRLQELIGTPISDGGGGQRPAQAADMAILLRSPKDSAPIYVQALEDLGIGAVADVGGALFTTPEVEVFLELLRAIDNRRRDLPLMAAMRMAGNFSSEALAKIRTEHPKGSFFEAVNASGDPECKSFLARLLTWREQARSMPLEDFLRDLLTQTGHEQKMRLSFRGENRLANLRALCALAAGMPGATLGDFLSTVAHKARAADTDAAQLPADDQNAVRIMSIHKSKGLEFPIVVGAGLGKEINMRDRQGMLLLHRDLGIGLTYQDESVMVRAETPARAALALKATQQSLAEELRVLYVLMTRACDRLILVGTLPSTLEKYAVRWAAAEPSLYSASRFIDWIGGVLLRHPDGQLLRDAIPGFVPVQSHPSRFSIRCMKGGTLPKREREDHLASALLTPADFLPFEIADRLAYVPTLREALPQKTSVTAQLRTQRRIHRPPALPRFMGDGADTPAARGTQAHAALRGLDFSAFAAADIGAYLDILEGQLDRMVEYALLTRPQVDSLPRDGILGFLQGETGQMALHSPKIYKEQPFNLRIDDWRLMQGIIDVYFAMEDGQWMLLDYKTDRRDLQDDQIRLRHGDQLALYAQALTSLTGIPVASCRVVVLGQGGRTVEVPVEVAP